jgi:hypothetical protein
LEEDCKRIGRGLAASRYHRRDGGGRDGSVVAETVRRAGLAAWWRSGVAAWWRLGGELGVGREGEECGVMVCGSAASRAWWRP